MPSNRLRKLMLIREFQMRRLRALVSRPLRSASLRDGPLAVIKIWALIRHRYRS
ncbi:hypothetical protein [Sphingomonas mucosissima]|uniref:hypothetical protein n=1 Tax=Sphingomonas mucosissima TaxID=370959 RepID=UPI001469F55D|nr:hypothetical protein [Sphingomonas mucosissima]